MKHNQENKNGQVITDLFYMIKAGKDLEEQFNTPNQKSINNKNSNYGNYNNKKTENNLNENNNLEEEVNKLKDIIISFEEKYGYISPYHDDIINKLKEKKVIQNLSNEISQKIYELYQDKYYIDCYDLWSIYGFKLLYNISTEQNFEILSHLTKVKNEFSRRKNILQNLDNFNLFNDNNIYFETGISFKQINNKNNLKNNKRSLYNKDINNDIANKINENNVSFKTYNDNINKQKYKYDNLLLEELKKRNLNYSYNK